MMFRSELPDAVCEGKNVDHGGNPQANVESGPTVEGKPPG